MLAGRALFPFPRCALFLYFSFFFQAEDGIRDYKVTGVQTCALPISVLLAAALGRVERLVDRGDDVRHRDLLRHAREVIAAARTAHAGDQLRAPQLAE